MKTFASLLIILSLGLFSIGCGQGTTPPATKPSTPTAKPADKPSTPAAKPADKPADKPAAPK